MSKTFNVTISNTFEADTPEDAVKQMVEYLSANAGQAGYRWEEFTFTGDKDNNATGFIDAEDVYEGFQ